MLTKQFSTEGGDEGGGEEESREYSVVVGAEGGVCDAPGCKAEEDEDVGKREAGGGGGNEGGAFGVGDVGGLVGEGGRREGHFLGVGGRGSTDGGERAEGDFYFFQCEDGKDGEISNFCMSGFF